MVRSCRPENVERILGALEELDGFSRLHQKKIKPNESHLEAQGHLLRQTRFGHLDLLGTTGAGRDYNELMKHSVTGRIRGFSFHMLDIETLILTKEEVGRDKDRMVPPILRATIREKQKRD